MDEWERSEFTIFILEQASGSSDFNVFTHSSIVALDSASENTKKKMTN